MSKQDIKKLPMGKVREFQTKLARERDEIEILKSTLEAIKKLSDKADGHLKDANKAIYDSYEVFISITKIEIDGVDAIIDILKNVLSISLTGWIALLALPVLQTNFVLGLCITLFFISFILIILFILQRSRLKDQLVLNHGNLIKKNGEDADRVIKEVGILITQMENEGALLNEKITKAQDEGAVLKKEIEDSIASIES